MLNIRYGRSHTPRGIPHSVCTIPKHSLNIYIVTHHVCICQIVRRLMRDEWVYNIRRPNKRNKIRFRELPSC